MKAYLVLLVLLVAALSLNTASASVGYSSCQDIPDEDSSDINGAFVAGITVLQQAGAEAPEIFVDEKVGDFQIEERFCETDSLEERTFYKLGESLVDCGLGVETFPIEYNGQTYNSYQCKFTQGSVEGGDSVGEVIIGPEGSIEGEQETEDCRDTDGGLDPWELGTIYEKINEEEFQVYTDTCSDFFGKNTGPSGTDVLEGHCNAIVEGVYSREPITCNIGCSEGVCLPPVEGATTSGDQIITPGVPETGKRTSVVVDKDAVRVDPNPTVAPDFESSEPTNPLWDKIKAKIKEWTELDLFADLVVLSLQFNPLLNANFGGGLFGALEEKCKVPYDQIDQNIQVSHDSSSGNLRYETYYKVSGRNGEEDYQCVFRDDNPSERSIDLTKVWKYNLISQTQQDFTPSNFNGHYAFTVMGAILDAMDEITTTTAENLELVRTPPPLENGGREITFDNRGDDASSYLVYTIRLDANESVERFDVNLRRDDKNPQHLSIFLESPQGSWDQKFITEKVRLFLHGENSGPAPANPPDEDE